MEEEQGVEIPIIWVLTPKSRQNVEKVPKGNGSKTKKEVGNEKEHEKKPSPAKSRIKMKGKRMMRSVRLFQKRTKRAPLGQPSTMEATESNEGTKVAPSSSGQDASVVLSVSEEEGQKKTNETRGRNKSRRKLSAILAAASSRRIFGSRKGSEKSVEEKDMSVSNLETDDESSLSSLDKESEKSVVSLASLASLAGLVAEREEEMIEETIAMIGDVLYEFDDDVVREELKRQKTVVRVDLQDSTEAQLAAIVDEIEVCRGCVTFEDLSACFLLVDGDSDSVMSVQTDTKNDVKNDDATSSCSDSAALNSNKDHSFSGGSSISNAIGKLLKKDTRSIVEDSSSDGNLTLEETLELGDESLDEEYDKLDEALELLRRLAACQGMDEMVLLDKICTDHERRELEAQQ